MSPRVIRQPLSWYCEKLERGEPFTSLLYGDGEFQVMSGRQTGKVFTGYRERITQAFADEMLASLDVPGDDIIRGSDEFLLDWRTYGGNDLAQIKDVSEQAQRVIGDRQLAWHDGTIWDTAVREGKLGPFFKALKRRCETVLAGCNKLESFARDMEWEFVAVPDTDAYSAIDETHRQLHLRLFCYDSQIGRIPLGGMVVIVCAGLSAIPLILRLRDESPKTIFLDLGSTFDVFAGIGQERGWRRDLYADPAKLKQVIDANMAWRTK